jgi:hypothetical protein
MTASEKTSHERQFPETAPVRPVTTDGRQTWQVSAMSNDLKKTGNAQKASAVGSAVRLTRRGQHLVVEPPSADLIAALQSRFRLAGFHPVAGNEMRAIPIPLHRLEDHFGQPSLRVVAGLEPAVQTLLRRAGRPVVLLGRRPPRSESGG